MLVGTMSPIPGYADSELPAAPPANAEAPKSSEVPKDASGQESPAKPKAEVKASESSAQPESPKQESSAQPESPKQESSAQPESPKQESSAQPESPKQESSEQPESPKQESSVKPEETSGSESSEPKQSSEQSKPEEKKPEESSSSEASSAVSSESSSQPSSGKDGAENGDKSEKAPEEPKKPLVLVYPTTQEEWTAALDAMAIQVSHEVYDPIPDMTNAAPFLAPVVGTAPMRLRSARSATADPTPESGMQVDKTVQDNHDGTYTISLEAFATGNAIVTETSEAIPTDIVLVLDQSGSMDDPFNGTTVSYDSYGAVKNNKNWTNRNNLWILRSDGKYAQVTVSRTPVRTFIAFPPNTTNGTYYDQADNLYTKVDGGYSKVDLDRRLGFFVWKYYYYFNGERITKSYGSGTVPDLGNYAPLYYLFTDYVYRYSYLGADGRTVTLPDSKGDETVYGTPFFAKNVRQNVKKIVALKAALNNFERQVRLKALGPDGIAGTADDVNHRVAVIGFSENQSWNYASTELFIGSNTYRYDQITNQYQMAFQSMNTDAGAANVVASINALEPDGSTYIDVGIDMANKTFRANPIPSGEKRNRVVVVFTDGAPGFNGEYDGAAYGNEGDAGATAQKALANVATIKASPDDNGCGATVYTVGIFSGADAASEGSDLSTASKDERANWFMQHLSSNNGVAQNPSYYLSANNAEGLNSIFQHISEQIVEGGTTSTLTETAVVKDIVSSSFSLPDGADANDITLETWRFTGFDSEGKRTWSKNPDAMGATAEIVNDSQGRPQVNVKGFDFSENYVGTLTNSQTGAETYRGDKLVIRFKVKERPGFLGGIGVDTNASAGIYTDENATEPVVVFPKPEVNVPIPEATVVCTDKNAYYYSYLTVEQLSKGGEVHIGDQVLKLDEENYGLAPWQTEYIDLKVIARDENGKEVKPLIPVKDCYYTLEVTVKPKTAPPAGVTGFAPQVVSDRAYITVFKPELHYKNSEVFYGDDEPTSYGPNFAGLTWRHGDKLSTDAGVVMTGEMPIPKLIYTPEAGKIVDGKINSKEKIGVSVQVTAPYDDGTTERTDDITSAVTFYHPDCPGGLCPADQGYRFYLIPKTGTLTITKKGGVANEPYVFMIYRDGEKYTEATIVGNGTVVIKELPVGSYTIHEDEVWSWRWKGTVSGGALQLDEDNPNPQATCNNVSNGKNFWLNAYSAVKANVKSIGN